MTQTQRPQVRDQFVRFMNTAKGIEQLVAHHKAEERGEHKDALEATLRGQAYQYAVSQGMIDPAVVTSPGALPLDQVQTYLGAEQQQTFREASHTLSTPAQLETLLEELSDAQVTALAFAGDEKGRRFVPSHSDEAYEAWFANYAQYTSQARLYADFAERAKEGSFGKDDEKLVKQIIQEVARAKSGALVEKLAKDHKYLGQDHILLLARLTEQAVLAGYHGSPDKLIPGHVDTLIKRAETALAEHCAAHPDKNLRGYLAGALTPGITSTNPQEYRATRDLVYRFAKGE